MIHSKKGDVMRNWTYKEIKYLLENYYDVPNKILAKKLGRTELAIRSAHVRYKPKQEKREKRDIYAYYKGDELLIIGTVKEIAEYLNVKETTIYRYYCKPESLKNGRIIKVEKIRGSEGECDG